MKKLLCVIAVFALTAPVFAADGDPNVAVTIVDEGGGVVQVHYTLLAEDGFVPGDDPLRGIALKLTTSNAVLFDAISEYATGSTPADSTQIPLGFSVFMGSIQFAADPNFVSNFGTPVAPSGDPGAGGDLPDATEIVVEMGTLYTGANAPGSTGMLFKLTLDANGETDTVLGIEGESTRGGDLGECVLESGQQANIVLSGVADAYKVTFGGGCFVGTTEQVAAWNFWGQPANWCEPCFKCGDVNSSTSITPGDWFKVWDDLKAQSGGATHDGSSDVNMSGSLTPSDWFFVWDQLKAGAACTDPACQ